MVSEVVVDSYRCTILKRFTFPVRDIWMKKKKKGRTCFISNRLGHLVQNGYSVFFFGFIIVLNYYFFLPNVFSSQSFLSIILFCVFSVLRHKYYGCLVSGNRIIYEYRILFFFFFIYSVFIYVNYLVIKR